MSTDLATVATQLPAHLRNVKTSTFEEFAAGLPTGIPLPFLSIRGKEFRIRKDGQELNTRQRDMNVIFIAARHSVSKRFYIKKYETGSLEAPDCSSRDGVTPDVAEPIHPNCQHCPKNQWGSRITEGGKEGKACSDYKRVVLWAVDLANEPVVLDVAATSLKAPKGQKHAVLMMGDYMSQLAKHGMDPTTVVTRVSFTDAEYPQLSFSFERFVTEEEWLRVQELRESDDVATCIDANLFEGKGEVKDVKTPDPEPRTSPKPDPVPEPEEDIPLFPGQATIMKDGDAFMIAQDEEQWAKLWAEGYRPQESGKVASESKPQPEPEPQEEAKYEPAGAASPEPEAAPEKSDLLAEVAALLGGKK